MRYLEAAADRAAGGGDAGTATAHYLDALRGGPPAVVRDRIALKLARVALNARPGPQVPAALRQVLDQRSLGPGPSGEIRLLLGLLLRNQSGSGLEALEEIARAVPDLLAVSTGQAARALAIIPWAMPEVVVGIMWRLVYNPDAGILNETVRDLGLGDGRDWLTGLATALPAVILVGIWAGMPQTTVALLAGLQNTPHELHEAAALDGAGAWRRFRTVTWPAIRPIAHAISALNLIWNFNSFALVYVLTSGGPGGRTRLPMLFAYEEAFRY
nr:sugar ABC transporter permease [Streptomyces sp. DSM 41633]